MSKCWDDTVVTATLQARLRWIEELEGEPVRTAALIDVHFEGTPIWPVSGDPDTDLDIFVDDVLRHLTWTWKALLLRQDYPASLRPSAPSRLQAAAEDRPQPGAEALLAAVESFSRTHDLGRAFGGQYELPSLWCFRQGEVVLVEADGRLLPIPLESWLQFATLLGDEVAHRLESCGDRFQYLVDVWALRDEGDAVAILGLATGQSREVSEALIRDGLVTPEVSVLSAANDDDELRVAARMVGPIPYLQIQSVLQATAQLPLGDASELDRFAGVVGTGLDELSGSAAPHEEGTHAARAARAFLELAPEERADPLAALVRLGAPVVERPMGLATLDALAVWGARHGPAVLVNSDSRRFGGRGMAANARAARITLAHKLCHLALDRGHALAAVDILGGRVPDALEKRARAFQAEFLLPASAAAAVWRRRELLVSREGVDLILNRLADRFGVSRSLAAWQLDHGLLSQDQEVLFWLDELVPQRRERTGRR